MTITTVVPYTSTPPSAADPANFDSRADDLLGTTLPAMVEAINDVADEINSTAEDINSDAVSAAESAAQAAISAATAISGSDAEAWVSGASYTAGDVVYSPIDFQNYRRKSNGAGTDDPSTTAGRAVWARIGSGGNPAIQVRTSVTSPLAWNSDDFDGEAFTALANALTINADSGSPWNGKRMLFRFEDSGTARALTWTTGSSKSFRAIGVTLPTTTVIGKTLYVGCIYNTTDSRWDVLAVAQEA